MDIMLQLYLEETEELLQSAEESIIQLERDYSSREINELFRIVHTIKGSSQLMGYDDIGDLMHRIEDLLDFVRNGSLTFDQSIIAICFEGIDIVKKMLELKKETGLELQSEQIFESAKEISSKVNRLITLNKKQEENEADNSEIGIVSSLLNKTRKGKNKFYVSFIIEEDAPMVSPVLLLIFQAVDDIGALVYSSVSDEFFNSLPGEDIKSLEIIITTDLSKTELIKRLDLCYVEDINIIDLNQQKVQKTIKEIGSNGQQEMIQLMEKVCAYLRNNEIFRTFKPEKNGYIDGLRRFVDDNPVSTLAVFVDMSCLTMVHESDIKELIQIKHDLKKRDVELIIIVDSLYARRIVNVFDCLSGVVNFKVYKKELEAIISIYQLERLIKWSHR